MSLTNPHPQLPVVLSLQTSLSPQYVRDGNHHVLDRGDVQDNACAQATALKNQIPHMCILSTIRPCLNMNGRQVKPKTWRLCPLQKTSLRQASVALQALGWKANLWVLAELPSCQSSTALLLLSWEDLLPQSRANAWKSLLVVHRFAVVTSAVVGNACWFLYWICKCS